IRRARATTLVREINSSHPYRERQSLRGHANRRGGIRAAAVEPETLMPERDLPIYLSGSAPTPAGGDRRLPCATSSALSCSAARLLPKANHPSHRLQTLATATALST